MHVKRNANCTRRRVAAVLDPHGPIGLPADRTPGVARQCVSNFVSSSEQALRKAQPRARARVTVRNATEASAVFVQVGQGKRLTHTTSRTNPLREVRPIRFT